MQGHARTTTPTPQAHLVVIVQEVPSSLDLLRGRAGLAGQLGFALLDEGHQARHPVRRESARTIDTGLQQSAVGVSDGISEVINTVAKVKQKLHLACVNR
jgi:hypothetical protein